MYSRFEAALRGALALVLAGHALVVHADVVNKLVAQRVSLAPDGKEMRQPAGTANPGDVVEYKATYFNTGPSAIARLFATVPIPAGTSLVGESAMPMRAQASVDGTHFEATPLKRLVKLPDGSTREESVPLSEYRALRWDMGKLEAQQDTAVRLRVLINPVSAAPLATRQ